MRRWSWYTQITLFFFFWRCASRRWFSVKNAHRAYLEWTTETKQEKIPFQMKKLLLTCSWQNYLYLNIFYFIYFFYYYYFFLMWLLTDHWFTKQMRNNGSFQQHFSGFPVSVITWAKAQFTCIILQLYESNKLFKLQIHLTPYLFRLMLASPHQK